MANKQLLDDIHRVDNEIQELQREVKNTADLKKDWLQGNDTFGELQQTIVRVKELRETLRLEMREDSNMVGIVTEEEELKFKLKDLRDILSHYLVQYHDETEDSQVPLEDPSRAKPLIMSAKLGKEEYYQERMQFGAARS